MLDRFESLTTGVSQIYKNIQKIKKKTMGSLGLKGAHVMCLHYLNTSEDGLTSAQLCQKCDEDKAGISRIMADLEARQLIRYTETSGRKYRAKATLTPAGIQAAEALYDVILCATMEGGNGITEEERSTFYHVLFLIADNLQNFCDNMKEIHDE